MSDNNGFVAFHRKILDNPVVCKDSDHYATWSYLILNATHTEQKKMFAGKPILLKPGMLITGRKKIASFFNISESKVQRILKLFENEHQIEQQTCNQNRLITLLNWNTYQITEQRNKQRVNNERTTSEQRVNTNNNVNNVNNDNNVNNKHKHGEYKNVLLTDEEVERLQNDLGSDYESMLQEFSEGLKMKDYKYKDHNLAIRKWYRKRQTPTKESKTDESIRKFLEREKNNDW